MTLSVVLTCPACESVMEPMGGKLFACVHYGGDCRYPVVTAKELRKDQKNCRLNDERTEAVLSGETDAERARMEAVCNAESNVGSFIG
jgi:hypothetical protein